MNLLNSITKENDSIELVKELISNLGIKITGETIRTELESHPEYPSLLSVSDFLLAYKIDNMAVRIKASSLKDLTFPCVVPVVDSAGDEKLVLMNHADEKTVNIFDTKTLEQVSLSLDDFQRIWTSGVVLIINSDDAVSESDYPTKLRKLRWTTFVKVSVPTIFIAFFIYSLINFSYQVNAGWRVAAHLLLSLLGALISAILVWYEIDRFNPLLRKICTAGHKVNCDAVIGSDYSHIGSLSLSVLGCTYFTGNIVHFLVTAPGSESYFGIFQAVTSLLMILVVGLSLYYQKVKIKQWCTLCLAVQAVLFTQFLIVGSLGVDSPVYSISSSATAIPGFFVVYLLVYAAINFVSKFEKTRKSLKGEKRNVARFRRDPNVFNTLLAQQKKTIDETTDLGVVLGNLRPRVKIIKVCNPFCGPCAKAHKPIEEILDQFPDLQVQIIFTTSNQEPELRRRPVQHILAMNSMFAQDKIRHALDDWYLSENKNYDVFASKHPLDVDFSINDEKIDQMKSWCEKNNITHTPTFFINGHLLPDSYNIEDLKYTLYSSN
jgi:uncharacterized membrane protein